MVKLKCVLSRIVPFVLALVLVSAIAVPAMAYPEFPIPDDTTQYYHFDYVPDIDDGAYGCSRLIPFGYYQIIVPSVDIGVDPFIYFPPFAFLSASPTDFGGGITGNFVFTVLSFDMGDGLVLKVNLNIGNLDFEIMGYNSALTFYSSSGDPLVSTQGVYLVPLDPVVAPDLSPSEYYEFPAESISETMKGSFSLPDGRYYALIFDGDDTYFTQPFAYDPSLDGGLLYSWNEVMNVFQLCDGKGFDTGLCDISIVSMADDPVSFLTFKPLGSVHGLTGIRVLLVRIPGASDKIFSLFSAMSTWFVTSLGNVIGILYSAETGLTIIGAFAVFCGGFVLIMGIVLIIKSWIKHR